MSEAKLREDIRTKDGAPLGKREQTKATNRSAILVAAREVFAELGYGATTVRDIIRKTGLASGTFYNYFKSKEEVFEAIMDANALQVRPRLREQRLKAKDFPTFIRGTFHTFFDYVANDRNTYAVLRRNSGTLRVRMDTPEIVAGFEELQKDLEDAIANGLAPNVDASYLTASMIGIAFEMSDRMVLRDDVDVEEATEFASNLLLGGINAVPAKK
jgi:AcrR family transcriptional regulator